MFQPADSVLIGVSGGSDSVALLYILLLLAPKLAIRLGVAHLNHGLRGEASERDARFVSALAEKNNLPFFYDKVNVPEYRRIHKLSEEEASRCLRYEFFNRIAKKNGYQKIALGHQADDNAELILMCLLRGSGTLGASGIAPVRNGKLVRPLIDIRKKEILEFLNQNDIQYVNDATNTQMRYLRNRVRHQLIPCLKSTYNPNIVETLNRLSSILRAEEEWISHQIHHLWSRLFKVSEHNRVHLGVDEINNLHIAAKRRILRHAIRIVKGNLRRITFSHIEQVIVLCEEGPKVGSLHLPDRIRIDRHNTLLKISKEARSLRNSDFPNRTPTNCHYEYRFDKPQQAWIEELGAYLRLTEISAENPPDYRKAGHRVAFIDMNMIEFPLLLRNPKPGDRFKPLGMKGTQKVKTFFINNKIPRGERNRCPVMISRGKIIWVVGHRIDDSVKISPETRRILKAELLLA